MIDRLDTEIQGDRAQSPEIKALHRSGSAPFRSTSPSPAELQKFLASEIDRWGGIIETAGLAKSQ